MLCLATLTLAALGPWTYAGFLADPPPPATPGPAVPTVPAAPILPPGLTPEVASEPLLARLTPELESSATPLDRSSPSPAPATPLPPPARPARSSPVLYRMPDATGQVWEHADPSWLQAYVMDRNRQFVRSCLNRACR